MGKMTAFGAMTIAWVMAGAAGASVPVYSNDFESGSTANFTGTGGYTPIIVTAPNNTTKFLGNLSTGQTTAVLTLDTTGLTSLTLNYDLYSILSQDGNANGAGGGSGDSFVVTVGNTVISNFTFANYFGNNVQSFGGSDGAGGYITGAFQPQTGATAVDTLGYGIHNGYDDATYAFGYSFAVTGPTTTITFTSNDNEGVGNEFYGIDNIVVTGEQAVTSAAPEPASWAMMVGGFGVMGAAMRRRPRTAVRFA